MSIVPVPSNQILSDAFRSVFVATKPDSYFSHSFPPGVIDVSPIFSPFSLTSSILNFILPPKGRDARIEKLYLLFCFIHIPLKPEFVIDNLPVPSLSIMRANLGLFSSNSLLF